MTQIIPGMPRIGCAGWSLPRDLWPAFPAEGSHLERYAQRFDAVEIDTSFYRPHKRETYERWAASTPSGFRFAVKLPKTVTHELRLAGAMPAFDEFLAQVAGLGDRLGCLVVQLPPSLAFDAAVVRRFLADVRQEARRSCGTGAEASQLVRARGRVAAVALPGRARAGRSGAVR
jgi:uncharacterized protein YecE (DUF72 family)